jgi:hypothetical protein
VKNEEAIDGDTEGIDDTIDDVETRVGGPTFDLGDRLSAEAGSVGEPGL